MRKGSVTYDSRSFIINGQRQFLTSGTIHYFRVPQALWRDRLEKAKAFGLNCIETYVAWNYHEAVEGVYDFAGERDVEHFLALCKELGLWVVLRPGPYICAEWDFGGFPAWLAQKQGIRFRHYDPIYLKYVDRWFDVLLPKLAKWQVTRGGTVFMVQAENELGNVARDDAAAYMAHLVEGFRRRGVDVVINTCAGAAEGTIECINSHDPGRQIADMRRHQPGAPLFSTEFWPGWYAIWHSQNRQRPPHTERYEAATWRFIALGASGYNYYMWHGGTNFGYTTMYLQTTSYDYTSPLSEAGGLAGEKWHRLRLPAMFGRAFAAELAAAGDGREVKSPARGVAAYVRPLEKGQIHFLHNTGRAERQVATPAGPVTLPGGRWATAMEGVPLGGGLTLDRCTAGVLARTEIGGLPGLVLYGAGEVAVSGPGAPTAAGSLPVRTEGLTAVASREAADTLAESVISFGKSRLRLVWVSEAEAACTWPLEGKVVVGPYLARPQGEGVQAEFDQAPARCVVVSEQAAAVPVKVASRLPDPPQLTGWQTMAQPCPEYHPDRDDRGWLGMYRPLNKLLVGDGGAYAWYRAELELGREWSYPQPLHFSALADRALIFWNGRLVGTSEATDAEDRPFFPSYTVTVRPRAGRNVLAVLTDNLGLGKGDWQVPGRVHERDARGLFGPVWLAQQREITCWRFQAGLDGERLGWSDGGGSGWQAAGGRPAPSSWHRATFRLTKEMLAQPRPVRFVPDGLSKGVLWVNGHNLGRYWANRGQRDWYVPECWLAAENTLVLYEETAALPLAARLAWDEWAVLGRAQV